MKAVPPLKLSLLREQEPCLQAACTTGLDAQVACAAPPFSPRTAGAAYSSAQARRSSHGVVPGSSTSVPQTDNAPRRMSGCEQALMARQVVSEEKELEPGQLLERLSLWGTTGMPMPRSSSCSGMPTTPRLALEPPPTIVAAVGTQVAVLRAQLQTEQQQQEQQAQAQQQVHISANLASPLPHAGAHSTSSLRPRSSLSLSGTPPGKAARAGDAAGLQRAGPAPLPAAEELPQPTEAQLRVQSAQAVAAPVRRCYLKQLMDCYTPKPQEQQGPQSLPGYLQGGDSDGATPGSPWGKNWHELPAEVTNFLRFHTGGKKAFRDQMATEAKQVSACCLGRSWLVPHVLL